LAGVDVHSVTIPFHAKKLSLSSRSFKNREGGGWEKGGGGGGSQKPLFAKGRDLKFCWLKFAKNFEKVFEKSYGPFLTFLPTFLNLRSSKKSLRYPFKATDMNIMT
jgi:hypothetical protein